MGRSETAGGGDQMAGSTVCCKDTSEYLRQEWYLRINRFPPTDLSWHNLYKGFFIRSARVHSYYLSVGSAPGTVLSIVLYHLI